MITPLPDVWISHGQVVFGGAPRRGGFVTKGYAVLVPSIDNSAEEYRNCLEDELRAVLRSMTDPLARLQFQWTTESDGGYREELLAYYERTKGGRGSKWSTRSRSERFTRYFDRLDGGLRRERLRVFLTVPISSESEGQARGREGYDLVMQEMSRSFESFESVLHGCFTRLGGRIVALDDAALNYEFARIFDPSIGSSPIFDPAKSVLQNCLGGEAAPFMKPDVGFYLDGQWHAVMAIKSLPQITHCGLIREITSLPFGDYSITVNVSALDGPSEIAKEEEALKRLNHTLRHSDRARMASAATMKQERIRRLMSGAIAPFRAQFILRTWAPSKELLRERLQAMKSAVLRMASAKTYECSVPTSAVQYFLASLPGRWNQYSDLSLYIEDVNLANLLPISASTGDELRGAEALYDSGSGGLIGIKGFSGESGGKYPLHCLISGRTGSGKSLLVNDLLTQTEGHYGYTVIVDNGNSYGTYLKTVSATAKTFDVAPDGSCTFNYLDTCGTPLTSEHLVDTVAVALNMATGGREMEITPKWSAILSRSLMQFYRDTFRDWVADREAQFEGVCREAILTEKFRALLGTQALWIEGWRALNEWKQTHPSEFAAVMAEVTVEEVEHVRLDEGYQDLLFRLSFCEMSGHDAKTHTDFRNWLEVESMGRSKDSQAMGELATLLTPWCAGGAMAGILFDGPGTVDFKSGSIFHIELGNIPDSSPQLRALVALIVTNQIRNQIVRLPRSVRKRVILEELSAFLAIPGGDGIVRDFYTTARKFGTWVIGVVQQLPYPRSPAFDAIIGNTRLAIMLGQSDGLAANALADAFSLPLSARQTLTRMPEPSREQGAAFMVCHMGGSSPLIQIGRNVVHPEMYYLAASGGDHFEMRKAELAKYVDVVEGIIAGANKK